MKVSHLLLEVFAKAAFFCNLGLGFESIGMGACHTHRFKIVDRLQYREFQSHDDMCRTKLFFCPAIPVSVPSLAC